MANNKQLTKLQKEIEKNFKKALKDTTVQMNEAIEYMYENAITLFYESFEPNYYVRTYSTYYGSDLYDNIAGKYDVVPQGNTYTAGITVSPKNIPGQPYYKNGQSRPDKAWVFERTYIKGIHGITTAERRSFGKNAYWDKKVRKSYRTSFKNWLRIKKIGWQFNQYKNVRYPEYTIFKYMSSDSYNLLVGGKNYLMKPSPSDIMWANYSEFRKPQNVKNFFYNNFIYMLSKNSK